MKTIRFLEKRSTWIWLLITLPAAPIIALAFPRMDVMTGFKRISMNAQHYEQPSPKPDATMQFQKLLFSGNIPNLTRFEKLSSLNLDRPELFYLPEFQQIASRARKEFGTWIDEYGELATRSAIRSHSLPDGANRGGIAIGGMMYHAQHIARVARLLALSAVADGETSTAMHYLGIAAVSMNPFAEVVESVRTGSYLRGTSLEIFEELLHGQAPGIADPNAALDKLAFSNLNPILELTEYFKYAADDYRGPDRSAIWEKGLLPTLVTKQFLSDAAWYLAMDSSHFHNPNNIRWANRLRSVAQQQYSTALRNPFRGRGAFNGNPWTEMPSLAIEFEHVVRTEPDLLPERLKLYRIMDGVDKTIAALAVYGFLERQRYSGDIHTQIRAYETHRLALKMAFASRRFRADNDRWPVNVNELAPAYLPALPVDSITSATTDASQIYLNPGKFPYGPLRVEHTKVTSRNVARILGLVPAIQGNGHDPSWTIDARVRVLIGETTSSRFRARLIIQRRSPSDVAPLDLLALAEKLKSSTAFSNVRITAGQTDLETSRSLQQALWLGATQKPDLKLLIQESGSTLPQEVLDPPDPSVLRIATTSLGPYVGIRCDVDMPDRVFCIVSDRRAYPQEPYLQLGSQTETGEPTGDLVVCAESFWGH